MSVQPALLLGESGKHLGGEGGVVWTLLLPLGRRAVVGEGVGGLAAVALAD